MCEGECFGFLYTSNTMEEGIELRTTCARVNASPFFIQVILGGEDIELRTSCARVNASDLYTSDTRGGGNRAQDLMCEG